MPASINLNLRLTGMRCLVASLVFFSASALAAQDLPTVSQVDLARYTGRWYEIARLTNRFERDCAGDVTATYAPLPEGRLSVLNQCRKADGSTISAQGVARLAQPGGSPSKLEVRFAPVWLGFLPMVWGDYWILALAEDYSWSLVGAPGRDYLWILSRNPRMEPAEIDRLLQRARELGFDTATVVRVNHR